MDEVISFISQGFGREYDRPENCLPWDGREGGWQGRDTSDSSDVVSDEDIVNWDQKGAERLHDDLVRAFGDRQFVERDPFGIKEHEGLRYSWESFCKMVKHHTRFVFFNAKRGRRSRRSFDPDEDRITPAKLILDAIGRLIEKHALVRELPRRSKLIRARQHKIRDNPSNAAELGSPPPEKASQSRMSPAGISMFYGAEDERTAFLETFDPRDKRAKAVTFATFETARKLRILDLTQIPDLPSIFDETGFPQRSGIIFLRHLDDDISKPIARDGREHYEYIPTQIAAEYFRSVLKIDGNYIDGIAFKSSRSNAGISYCIFAGPNACADEFRSRKAAPFSFSRKTRYLVLTSHSRRPVATCRTLYGV